MDTKRKKKMEEKIINDVIRKYGPIIDLKETPFVIIEIIRNFKSRFDGPDGGSPPGGVGGVGGPHSDEFHSIKNSDILKEILKLSKEIKLISKKLNG